MNVRVWRRTIGVFIVLAVLVVVLGTVVAYAARKHGLPALSQPTSSGAVKHPSNPVIPVRDANDMRVEQYVPSVSLVDGTYHAFVKGSNQSYHYTSPDGLSWTWANQFISGGGTGSWDSQYTRLGVVVYSDSARQFYALYDGNMTSGGDRVGLARSRTGESVQKDLSNPIVTPAILQPFAPAGRTVQRVRVHDVVRDPGTGELYLFGTIWYSDGAMMEDIWVARWDQFAGPQVLGIVMRARDWENVNSRPESVQGISSPNVYWDEGIQRWKMLVTVWYWSGVQAEVRGPAWAVTLAGPWMVDNDHLVLTVGPPGAWDDIRVHTSRFLKDNSCFCRPLLVEGSYRLYYSGSSLISGAVRDQSGLAELALLP